MDLNKCNVRFKEAPLRAVCMPKLKVEVLDVPNMQSVIYSQQDRVSITFPIESFHEI